jgi:hypothetical protein
MIFAAAHRPNVFAGLKPRRWVKITGLKTRHYIARGALRDFAGGFFEEFVDERLVGFGLLGGHAAELAEELRSDANGAIGFDLRAPPSFSSRRQNPER